MRLVSTSLYLGESRMVVIVDDDQNHRRSIQFSWLTKEKTDVPPAHWWEAVKAEVEYQRSEDLAEATGRKLPY